MATHWIEWHQISPDICQGGVVTIGNFDGVHRGHAALLLQVILQGKALTGPSIVITFDPHPLRLLRPELAPDALTSMEQRAALLHEKGVDQVVILKTSPDMLAQDADTFFESVVVRGLRARALVEGQNFGFGRGRKGNIATLAQLCQKHGLALTVVPPQNLGEEEISSSAARRFLQEGNVIHAAHLLARPYRLTGRVVSGAQRGRTLGFPTANLTDIQTLIPRDGVYACQVCVAERPWMAAVNIGPNPTFGENARKVEVHLLDFTGDLYGRVLDLDFIDRMRDTVRFDNIEQLRTQLHQDIAAVRSMMTEGVSS